MKWNLAIASPLSLILVLTACGDSAPKGPQHYWEAKETKPNFASARAGSSSGEVAPAAEMPMGQKEKPLPSAIASDVANASAGSPYFSKIVPKHWKKNAPGQMKLLSFLIGETEVSLVELGGSAGGKESNVARWKAQIGLEAPAESAGVSPHPDIFHRAPAHRDLKAEGDAFEWVLLQNPQNHKALMAAIIKIPGKDATLFVKVMGDLATVNQEKTNFLLFCKNLQLEAKPVKP
jgi:hypothetical protein